MASVEASIARALSSQEDLKTHREHCSADDDGRQQRLIAIAPHGGDIEVHTDQQAERSPPASPPSPSTRSSSSAATTPATS